jgi:hypothetical protein
MLSLKYLENRNIIPYMLLNLLGFLFHSSAIIFLPLYFFLHKEWPKKLIWGIFIGGILVFTLQLKYLEPVLLYFSNLIGGKIMLVTKYYLEDDFYGKPFGIGIGYVERIVTFLVIMKFYYKLKNQDSSNIIILNTYVLYFVVYFYFGEFVVTVERFSLLFAFSYWILYPNIIRIIQRPRMPNNFLYLVVFYCILKVALSNYSVFSKYDNLVFGIESYQERSARVSKDLNTVLRK